MPMRSFNKKLNAMLKTCEKDTHHVVSIGFTADVMKPS